MKHIIAFFIAFIALMAQAVVPAAQCTSCTSCCTPGYDADDYALCTTPYDNNSNVQQVISVKYTGGSDCAVRMYEKTTLNGRSTWQMTLACNGHVGKNGLGKEKEGDMKTPTGDWGIITAFGINPNPGTSLPWIDVKESTYCCDDATAYNRIIDLNSTPHKCTGEHMIKYVPEYNYGFFIDYNSECTIGKGSAIFFHCTGEKVYTAGCIAVPQQFMITILRTISPTARVIVHP
ncbi:MAG: hypothetical protein MJZ74_05035 [Muribaculaceae bacterium]|nr:hypothetical protein [Muribaculaceae bacterium]